LIGEFNSFEFFSEMTVDAPGKSIRSLKFARKAMCSLRIIAVSMGLSSCTVYSVHNKAVDYVALVYAATNGDTLLVEALINRGAPVDAPHPDSAGELSLQANQMDSPLRAAASSGNVDIVKMILKHRPWVDSRCCDSTTALGVAVKAGNVELVRVLLEAGADPAIRGDFGEGLADATSLDAARKLGYTEIVALIETAQQSRKR